MSKRKAFTLPELLIVIAIIALLISILLPVLWQVRRRAIVLVCPIAYMGDDGMLHLTDPYGKWDLDYLETRGPSKRGSRIRWSPSGQRIGLSLEGPRPAILDPMSGHVRVHPQSYPAVFSGWFDSSTFVDSDMNSPSRYCVRDVDTGAIRQTLVGPSIGEWEVASLPPHVTGGQFIAVAPAAGEGIRAVVLLRKDLTVGKVIAHETGVNPVVDPLGEWVAWYVGVGNGKRVVAIKRMSEPSSAPSTLVGQQFQSVTFCDWTEDGRLLVNAKENGVWGLAILDKSGNIVRRIPTAVPPNQKSYASWRKYGHR